jgi:hypothetical protein
MLFMLFMLFMVPPPVHFDDILDDLLELFEHCRFRVAVAALTNERRCAADVAPILVAPLGDLHVPGGERLDPILFYDFELL